MEEKELRLFSQLEELKSARLSEEEAQTVRMKDLDGVLNAKNQLICALEREVKQKEKILTERQEQLSILLSAMEKQSHGSSQESLVKEGIDHEQKLANMAAELCSLKAVEAQMERKVNDIAHSEKKALVNLVKLEKDNQLSSN